MSSSSNEYIRCQMRPKGGRRAPKSTERKSAGADRIIDLIEKGIHGCRLAAPVARLNKNEMRRVDKLNWFNALTKQQQLQHLVKKLNKLKKEKDDLYKSLNNSESEQKRMLMKRKLKEPVINIQIVDIQKQIEEINNME